MAKRRETASWYAKVALLLGSSLFALILCELALRVFSPLLPASLQDQFKVLAPGLVSQGVAIDGMHDVDPYLGWKMKTSEELEIRLRVDLPVTRITTNELGFRGAPPASSRVVIGGDSFAFGFGVQDDETVASVLQASLGKGVSTLGITGFRPLLHKIRDCGLEPG